MAHHIMLGSTQPSWALHASEDVDQVRERLRVAASTRQAVDVKVVITGTTTPTILTINPAQLGWWGFLDADAPRVPAAG
ncbi:hypothetical protein [Agrococcus jejuensis]|uniref:Uncharacterized protein n=1 Tax=Agrococcus jejuensis TaxID=399736 RepID=A0A1G8BBH8_9MICO|nr:hypothetical protein [Agrococcus jejuensis]SDH30464.1 hypothetical protein SAMN04489720_0843 [Agrococcus jejuensis]